MVVTGGALAGRERCVGGVAGFVRVSVMQALCHVQCVAHASGAQVY
jgi:hypothetical protein